MHGKVMSHTWRSLFTCRAAAGFSLCFTFMAPWGAMAVFLALFAAVTLSLKLLPVRHVPQRFRVPLFPFTPALGILFNVHLIGSLGWPAYVRFGVWMALGAAIYALYGVHGAEQREADHNRWARQHVWPKEHRRRQPSPLISASRFPTLRHSSARWRREVQERHAQRANGLAPRALGSLDREGYAGPMGSIEMEAGAYAEARVREESRQKQQTQRLMAGHADSAMYDAGED
jgi:hypothetical protein